MLVLHLILRDRLLLAVITFDHDLFGTVVLEALIALPRRTYDLYLFALVLCHDKSPIGSARSLTIHNAQVGNLFHVRGKSMSTNDMLHRAQLFVDRKYVSRADARQRAMGLSYVTAERQDLAREIVRFTINELERARELTQ